MFTVFDHDEYLFDALRLGASGFLVKDSPVSVIIAALKAAHAGEALLSTNVTARLIRAYITSRPRGTDEVMPQDRLHHGQEPHPEPSREARVP